MSGIFAYHTALARGLRWAALGLVVGVLGCVVALYLFDLRATFLVYLNVVLLVAITGGAIGALSAMRASE